VGTPLPELLGFLLVGTPEFHLKRPDERIGDDALIDKAITSQLAEVTCPISQLYSELPKTSIELDRDQCVLWPVSFN
jgi:hypothetical protein